MLPLLSVLGVLQPFFFGSARLLRDTLIPASPGPPFLPLHDPGCPFFHRVTQADRCTQAYVPPCCSTLSDAG